jgi:hypothetical protein
MVQAIYGFMATTSLVAIAVLAVAIYKVNKQKRKQITKVDQLG